MASYELSAASLFIKTGFPLQWDTSLFSVGGTMKYLLIREKLSHLFSTPWFPALARLERSGSIYRQGGRRWGWLWSRRLSRCKLVPVQSTSHQSPQQARHHQKHRCGCSSGKNGVPTYLTLLRGRQEEKGGVKSLSRLFITSLVIS